jgi:hypothetical protein
LLFHPRLLSAASCGVQKRCTSACDFNGSSELEQEGTSILHRSVTEFSRAAKAVCSDESGLCVLFKNLISGVAPSKSHRHAKTVGYPTFVDEV